VSCGTELGEWFHEAGSSSASLELVGGPHYGEEDREGGWWEVGCVGSGVVIFNG